MSDEYNEELKALRAKPSEKSETLYEVVKMVSSLEERIPFLNFISEVTDLKKTLVIFLLITIF